MDKLTHELCKELKEAGFAQQPVSINDNPNFTCPHDDDIEINFNHYQGCEDLIYSPTLEELIEACGEELQGINKISGDAWQASRYVGRSDYTPEDLMAYPTPLIAVARLWLALNKK